MRSTMNGIEYTTSVVDGTSTVSWDTGGFSSNMTELKALEHLVLKQVRGDRDEALRESDWRLSKDYPYDDQEQWKAYRQELRDLPSTYIHGNDIVLPTKP